MFINNQLVCLLPVRIFLAMLCSFALLNRAAVGWAVSCFALGLFFFFFSFVGEQTQTPTHGQLSSPDDVIISQLQAISQLFSSYPPSGGFCQVSELTVYTKKWRPKGENVNLVQLGPKSFGDGRQDICKDKASNLGPATG